MMSKNWAWSEELYGTYVILCVCSTNLQDELLRIRANNGQWYIQYLNRHKQIGNERKRKRAEFQALSRNHREQRLRIAYRQVNPNTEN